MATAEDPDTVDPEPLLNALQKGIETAGKNDAGTIEALARALYAIAPSGTPDSSRLSEAGKALMQRVNSCLGQNKRDGTSVAALARATLAVAEALPKNSVVEDTDCLAIEKAIEAYLEGAPILEQIEPMIRLALELSGPLEQRGKNEVASRLTRVILDRTTMSTDPSTLKAWIDGYKVVVAMLPENELRANLSLPFCVGGFRRAALRKLLPQSPDAPGGPDRDPTLWDWVGRAGTR
jgi:hypothetical protein